MNLTSRLLVEDHPLIPCCTTVDDSYLSGDELGWLQVIKISIISSRPRNWNVPKTRECGDARCSFPTSLQDKKERFDFI